jgi:serine protease AprX
MRQFKLVSLLAVVLALMALVAFSLPGTAGAAGHSAKIAPGLAALADSVDPNTDLSVIVLGSNLNGSGKHLGQLKRGLGLVSGVSSTVKAGDLDSLAADADVSFVAPDNAMAPTGTVDFSRLATQYPLVDNSQVAWDAGFSGRGVGIAVIDSGVAALSDFSGRLVQVTLPGQTHANEDTFGHGSLVAGIAAGQSTDGRFLGSAPGATVYALNVNNPAGVHSSDVITALQWVYENAHSYNIRVVNLSLSETVPSSYLQSTLDLAVERVWAAGITVVLSAGNLGAGNVNYAPGNDPLGLTVGALDTRGTMSTGDDLVASFTSSGITQDAYAKPELLAPGRLIASTLPAGTTLDLQAPAANRIAPGYVTISGTSFAAPQVAGAAAILFQQHPDWSPDQVKGILLRKGRNVSGSTIPGLNLNFVNSYTGTPAPANQGVLALVCAPGAPCQSGSTIASAWDSSSWNSASWNSASWNSASWNSASWNSASWNSSSWNSSSWNSSSWNSSSWNSSSWNSSSWN